MENTKRPGGLTFFAVINFIVAFILLAGACLTILSLAIVDKLPLDSMSEAQRANIEMLKNIPASSLAFTISKSILGGLLLILAGIGYLKQKKILGYLTGNLYVAVIVIYTVISPLISEASQGQGVISYVITLLYPVITLIILNFVYRKDFIK